MLHNLEAELVVVDVGTLLGGAKVHTGEIVLGSNWIVIGYG